MSPVSATFCRLRRQKLVVTGYVEGQNKLGEGKHDKLGEGDT